MPWLGATLDLLTVLAGQKIPLEIKLAIGSATDWREEAPLAHQCQAQVQAQCFGSDVVALAGLVGPGPLATFDLERDDAFFAALVPELELFRWHVQTKKPPAADGKPATSWAVRRRWAVEDGQTIQLDQETLALVARWEEAKARERGANAAAETFENEIRARLGGASFGSLPDGSHMKLALVKREGYEVKPTSYRVLRRIYPRIRRADVK
jgi:predicted phage-related endonuclease